jgi:hypothetical protein
MANNYTELPYIFDLLYDVKSVESLHDHLTGRCRLSTSGTDAQLIALARENDIPLPEDLVEPPATLTERHDEALALLKRIHERACASTAEKPLDTAWLQAVTAEVLIKNGIDVAH